MSRIPIGSQSQSESPYKIRVEDYPDQLTKDLRAKKGKFDNYRYIDCNSLHEFLPKIIKDIEFTQCKETISRALYDQIINSKTITLNSNVLIKESDYVYVVMIDGHKHLTFTLCKLGFVPIESYTVEPIITKPLSFSSSIGNNFTVNGATPNFKFGTK
jgi:hypothetical protein